MKRLSFQKLIACSVAGATILGVVSPNAAAEELVRNGTMFVYSTGAATQMSPQEAPVLVGVDRRYGVQFDEDGEFSNWVEYTIQFTYPTAGTTLEWRTYGAYIFPDGARIYYTASGTTDVVIGRSTGNLEIIGGTDQYVNATGTGAFQCFDPPSDPEGFPGLSVCRASEPYTITY